MAEKLIIRITDAAALDAQWLVLDANGNRVGFPQRGPLETAAPLAANRRVIVMLPGEHIVAADARVPGNNPRRILQAAPYALEERLAGDVDALHVALVHRGDDQHCDFMVVERDWLDARLAAINATGIRVDQAWPDYLGVPDHAPSTHWLITGNRLLCRDGWRGFAASASDAAFLHAHRDSESTLQLTVVGDEPLPGALGEREVARLDDDEQAFIELAAGIAHLPGAGLLQGAFRPVRNDGTDFSRWRWPAVAAAAWLALALASLGVDAWRLEREQAFLEQATRDLFQQAMPGEQRMVDPRFQLEQALGSADTGTGALDHIGDIAHAMQEVSNARLNGFNYRSDYFEMSVTVPDATVLENLRDALSRRAGQPVEVQSANSTQDGLEGRLLIAEKGVR